MIDERLWTPKDVASWLRVSLSWVYSRAANGELPCMRIGGLLRFEADRIRAYARGDAQSADVIALREPGRGS